MQHQLDDIYRNASVCCTGDTVSLVAEDLSECAFHGCLKNEAESKEAFPSKTGGAHGMLQRQLAEIAVLWDEVPDSKPVTVKSVNSVAVRAPHVSLALSVR